MAKHFFSVAVIGGGLSGPVLAIALQKKGVKATIYECRPKAFSQPGTIVLIPNSLRILDRIGVLDKIKEGAFTHTQFYMVKKDGSIIGRMIMGSETRYGYPALRVYRDTLRHALIDAAEKAGVEVKYSMRCVGIDSETTSSATAIFENGKKVEADLIVGADGVNSRIRPHLHPDVSSEYTGGMFITGSLDSDRMRPFDLPLPCAIPGPAGQFVLIPADVARRVISFFAWIDGEERTPEEWKTLGDNKKELMEIVKPFYSEAYPDVVRGLVTETPLDVFNCWPFQVVPTLETIVSSLGRVVIVGDAAHASEPKGGQGGSVSLEDAATLALAIETANIKADFGDAKSVLSQWESCRMQRVEQVEKAPMSMGMHMGPGNPLEEDGWSKETDQINWLYGYDTEEIKQQL